MKRIEQIRASIAGNVRTLRLERRWTQRDLAEKIGLSQARLSEMERGAGSFTAEQLLLMAQLFNVPVDHFAPRGVSEPDHRAELQNTLVRLGAPQLQENQDILPSARLKEVTHVVKEVLLVGTPRLVVALAPVLAKQIDQVNLSYLWTELREVGRERRLYWLAENVIEAIQSQRGASRELAAQYRRAETVLISWTEHARARVQQEEQEMYEDLLDTTIRSAKTLHQLRASRSQISRRWSVVSALQPAHFAEALVEAHAGT